MTVLSLISHQLSPSSRVGRLDAPGGPRGLIPDCMLGKVHLMSKNPNRVLAASSSDASAAISPEKSGDWTPKETGDQGESRQ